MIKIFFFLKKGVRTHSALQLIVPTTVNGTINGRMSIGIESWSDGRRWPSLMNHIFFHLIQMARCVRCLPEEHTAPGCIVGRRQAGRGSMTLWTMFWRETLRPVNVSLTRTTYLSKVHATMGQGYFGKRGGHKVMANQCISLYHTTISLLLRDI